MLKQRIITGVILAPLVVAGFVLLSPVWFAAMVGFIVSVGAWECARLAGEKTQLGRFVYAAIVALLLVGLYWLGWPPYVVLVPAAAWWVLATSMILRYPEGRAVFSRRLVAQLFGLLVLLPAWFGLVWLRAEESGLWLIMAAVVMVWAADIGAYFAGKNFGRHKLLPRVSPGKTVEGLLGGVLLAEVLAIATMLYLGWSTSSILLGAVGTLVVVVFSVVGDLTESLFKREQGLKDSSNLLPGHGGVMDRIDSLTAAIPIFALGWYLFGGMLG